MPEKEHITIRLDADLLARVEAYRQDLEKLTRQPVSRATALRALLVAGLEAVGK